MKHEIIYIDDYALIVSDEGIVIRDYVYCSREGFEPLNKQTVNPLGSNNDSAMFKVIAHRPLTDASILEGVPLLPQFTQEEDVKLIAKQEAEKLHDKSKHEDWDIYDELISEDAWLIEKGYNKAKETYKYTEEDLINAYERGMNNIDSDGCHIDQPSDDFNDFIQSLQQPKRPEYFEWEMEDTFLLKNRKGGNTVMAKPKTITNSQGQIELVGEYIY